MADTVKNLTPKRDSIYSNLKDDPEYLLSLIDKHVVVQLLKNMSFQGFVHCIDPVTNSIILSIPHGNTFQTTLLPGNAIVDVIEAPTTVQPPHRKAISQETDKDIDLRKNKLVSWFQKNFLPVRIEANNIVVGAAKVLPPYKAKDIYAENPIVAAQIRRIMSLVPENFES